MSEINVIEEDFQNEKFLERDNNSVIIYCINENCYIRIILNINRFY